MIDYIKIEGFKSVKMMELHMKPINILIGSNGSGKTNFISFFKLVVALFQERLQRYVSEEIIDNILYFGRKQTKSLGGKLVFNSGGQDNNAYNFALTQNNEGGLFIDFEGSGHNIDIEDDKQNYFYNTNLQESITAKSAMYRDKYLQKYMSSLQVFHFHDTSSTSKLRGPSEVDDNLYLKQDGRNISAFLYLLKQTETKVFSRILKAIQSVAPYISDFILEPSKLNSQNIELRWTDVGDPLSSFSAFQLSDGTLRFIALAALLMQPNPPKTIIIDEPELGLHPFAINKLAGMIRAASIKTQIIISTQSVNLIDNFTPEEVITVDRSEAENQSIFSRLSSENLGRWLEDYKLGALWQQNIINAAQPFSK